MRFRKHVRLMPDLYHQGWFFVTIVTRFRQKILVNEGREIIESVYRSIPDRHPGWHTDWFVTMSDHVHFIVVSHEYGPQTLADIVRTFKSYSAYLFRKRLGWADHLWQPNYYEHIIRSEKSLANIRRYIENNPLKEQLSWDEMDPQHGQTPNTQG